MKKTLNGRDAFYTFIDICQNALAGRRDDILAITAIDQQCAFVHARAWRKSRINGEAIEYE